jgi:two-component system, response regulator
MLSTRRTNGPPRSAQRIWPVYEGGMMSIESAEVLVVDDSLADAELTIHALKIGDVTTRVTWLATAEEALFYMFRARQYANRELATPHLMLLDVHMPGIGGVGVLERLKHDPRTKHVPIVMLSSQQDRATIRRCYELGANSYLIKPVAAIDYFQTIAAVANYWLALNAHLDEGAATRSAAQHAPGITDSNVA